MISSHLRTYFGIPGLGLVRQRMTGIVTKLGYDPIWFGILFCINMQVSFLSPPFGPAAFYLKSVAPPEITLIDIYRSFGPFVCLQLIVLMLVLFFPWLATALLWRRGAVRVGAKG